MPKQTPDPLTIRDRDGAVHIAPGSPLSRLQCAFDDEETGVFAGDLRDVCNACDAKDSVVASLVAKTKDSLKGERVRVGADEIEYLTSMLLAPPAMQVLPPTPAQVVQAREAKARAQSNTSEK